MPSLRPLISLSPAIFAMAALACGAAGGDGSGIGNGNAGGNSSGGTSGAGTGGFNLGASSSSGAAGGILTEPPPCDAGDPNVDRDGDGYAPNQGDCNDCAKQINPAAYDFPGNNVDEDCSGAPDDEPAGCDAQTVDVGYGDPLSAAAAIGLCRMAQGESWGVISAQYVQANGTPGMNDLSHGLVTAVGGFAPREGARMLMLSSGTARAPGDPGYRPPVNPGNMIGGEDMGTTCPTPPGFPVPAPACPNQPPSTPEANDSAALEVQVKTPSNANSFSFDFTFLTSEFPNYICQQFNDFFVALVDPAPANSQSGNVSFDSQGNAVSVNNSFLEVCSAQMAGGKNFSCPQGPSALTGTGYDTNAATGWLVTNAPVPAGEVVTIRFAIWDAGDHVLDSATAVDNFKWDVKDGELNPSTEPVK